MKQYPNYPKYIWSMNSDYWNFQIHIPRFYCRNGDFYLRFVTVIRLLWGSPSPNEYPSRNDYGIGIIILGFGFGLIYKKKI